MKRRFIFLGISGVVLVVVLSGLYYAFSQRSVATPGVVSEATPNTLAPSGGFTLEEISPSDILDSAPDISRGIRFSESIPQEVRDILSKKATEAVANIRANPASGADWFNLALYYHTANDYEGAREIWEFLTVVAPSNTVAFNNLGKLYHFSVPDFPKAEEYFMKSLAIDAESLTPYVELFDLYRFSYKTDTTAAVDIMKKAMTIFPDNLDLFLALGAYYRDRGDTAQARSTFTNGLDKARDAEDVGFIASFGNELARIP